MACVDQIYTPRVCTRDHEPELCAYEIKNYVYTRASQTGTKYCMWASQADTKYSMRASQTGAKNAMRASQADTKY